MSVTDGNGISNKNAPVVQNVLYFPHTEHIITKNLIKITDRREQVKNGKEISRSIISSFFQPSVNILSPPLSLLKIVTVK